MSLSNEHEKKLLEQANSIINSYGARNTVSKKDLERRLKQGLRNWASTNSIKIEDQEINRLMKIAIERRKEEKEKKEKEKEEEKEEEKEKKKNYMPSFEEHKSLEEKMISLLYVEPPPVYVEPSPETFASKPLESSSSKDLSEEEELEDTFESTPFFSAFNPENQPNITPSVKPFVLLEELKKYLTKDRSSTYPHRLEDRYGINEILSAKNPHVQKFRIKSIAQTSCKVYAEQKGNSLWYRAKINYLPENEQSDIIEKICKLAVRAAPVGTTFDLTNTPPEQEDMVYKALADALRRKKGIDQNRVDQLIKRRANAPSSSASSSFSRP